MKKSVAMKWIKALESGEYPQTRHTLQDENGYCCLGVLCSIALKSARIKFDDKGFIGGQTLTSQPGVMKWAGLKNPEGEIYKKVLLTLENDRGTSFKVIAQTIRDYWQQL